MNESIKYTVYPSQKNQQKQRNAIMLVIVGSLAVTAVLAMIFWERQPSAVEKISIPQVAPMVPNPASLPNPH